MFYQRLRDLREDKDLMQTDVAEKINLSVRQYGLYERGKADIPLEKALILADYYNVSLDYLAGRTKDKKGLTRSELSDKETELIKKFRSLSDERKGKIIERIEILAEEQEGEQEKIKGVV